MALSHNFFLCFILGVDVTANQDEISDHETFQLEFDPSTKRWYIRTMQDRYWTLETGGGIQAVADKKYVNYYCFFYNWLFKHFFFFFF